MTDEVVVRIPARPTKRATIQAIYDAVEAPAWAAPNLDGLADILRDLSWRAPGPLVLEWDVGPELPEADLDAIHDVLAAAVAESARSEHRLSLRVMT
jgi:Barstar (barnase inhibitor)